MTKTKKLYNGKVTATDEKERSKKNLEIRIFLPYWSETTTKLLCKWEKEYKGKVDLFEYLTEICTGLLGTDKIEKIKKEVQKCQQS